MNTFLITLITIVLTGIFMFLVWFFINYGWKKPIVKRTPLIYEDGNEYYFNIRYRGSISYHTLFVYRKVTILGINFYIPINDELIDKEFTTEKVKNKIEKVLQDYTAHGKLEDWDGFVGDIPDHVKRESRFKKLLGKDKKE
ncbi:MAG: hypothetical protein SLAVMIC_01000 [uncultured marine phage]|uniref:Uncharacterized protein n=1 Tax=uncultured marine phage TaxID=707152 RepID=A0A8D9FR95_9VIRU|nr:MAG: hypothetical protein SLAVMIC_01000 [uncultured marine phage]